MRYLIHNEKLFASAKFNSLTDIITDYNFTIKKCPNHIESITVKMLNIKITDDGVILWVHYLLF